MEYLFWLILLLLQAFSMMFLWRFIPDYKELEERARQAEPEEIDGTFCVRYPRKKRNWCASICIIFALLLCGLLWLIASIAFAKDGADSVPWFLCLGLILFIYLTMYALDSVTQRFLWDTEHLTRRSLFRRTQRWPWADLTAITQRYMKSAFELEFGPNIGVLIGEQLHGHIRLVADARTHLAQNRQTKEARSAPFAAGVVS